MVTTDLKTPARTPVFGPRRGTYLDARDLVARTGGPDAAALAHFEAFDTVYRSLVAVLFNFVPLSGHPGGSISSGRFVQALLFGGLDYDLADPDRTDADVISYAAGHKALGLYALWALRNEVARIAAPELLAKSAAKQLRLEDLLGFRRNPNTSTPLFTAFGSKALDGHPTPGTPFVRLSTGASGVGLPSSLGLAWAAADTYGADAPRVHVIEGEGGLTPGRVAEALAAAGTGSLGNAILHVDWNQASIDSNRVCRDGEQPGDYVQWTPAELAWLHDWNVIEVADGFDWAQVFAAQRAALELDNGQPTAIVYRTVKGWKYGIEGRASHGAGHPLCSEAFLKTVDEIAGATPLAFPRCENGAQRCGAGGDAAIVERCFWDALQVTRRALEERRPAVEALAARLREARERLGKRGRREREGAPRIEVAFAEAAKAAPPPAALVLKPGSKVTLREALGSTLQHYNRASGGAFVVAAADLLGSTSVNKIAEGFPPGFWNRRTNPGSRTLSVGGICEDAMSAMLAGIATFGRHSGVGSSYGAFLAPLGHIAARLHAIGGQARLAVDGGAHRPFFLVCAHAGLKTGEDGPTHADPQPLQLLQENFPAGTLVTLTPWEPAELWPLVSAALAARPAVIAPFVTRPPEVVPDREALGLAPAAAAAKGVYRLREPRQKGGDGVLVLQGSAVTYAFVEQALPLLEAAGIDLVVYAVTSAELFDRLPRDEREAIFPARDREAAMGVTDFTRPTLDRWLLSEAGRRASLHPFRHGHFLGSGQGAAVVAEAGLDGHSQFEAIREYLRKL